MDCGLDPCVAVWLFMTTVDCVDDQGLVSHLRPCCCPVLYCRCFKGHTNLVVCDVTGYWWHPCWNGCWKSCLDLWSCCSWCLHWCRWLQLPQGFTGAVLVEISGLCSVILFFLALGELDLLLIWHCSKKVDSHFQGKTAFRYLGEMVLPVVIGMGEIAPWQGSRRTDYFLPEGGGPSGLNGPAQLPLRHTFWALGCFTYYVPHQWPAAAHEGTGPMKW